MPLIFVLLDMVVLVPNKVEDIKVDPKVVGMEDHKVDKVDKVVEDGEHHKIDNHKDVSHVCMFISCVVYIS